MLEAALSVVDTEEIQFFYGAVASMRRRHYAV
jgi:hypothetical protein